METCFNAIENELNKSKLKIDSLNSRNTTEILEKVKLFNSEILNLNKTIPDIANKFAHENELTETQQTELKSFINSSVTKFIQDLRIPGINPDFKINI